MTPIILLAVDASRPDCMAFSVTHDLQAQGNEYRMVTYGNEGALHPVGEGNGYLPLQPR